MKINQILLFATILVLLILVSLEVILHETTKNNFINQRLDSSKSLSDFYASEITNPLYFGDLKSLKKVTNNMIQNPQITSVYVLTSKGNVITDGTDSNLLYSQHLTLSSCPITESTQRTIQITDSYICVLTPIVLSDHIGFLLIHFSIDDINLIIEEEIWSVFLSIGSLSILLIILNVIAKKFIINPILQLKQTTKEIAKGNLEEKIEFSGSDEMKELAEDVNLMQKSINQAQKDLVKNERFLAIGELSSRLSHDIRNPLSIIKLAVDLWKKNHKEMTGEELKSIEMIDNANSRIKYLIENVLNFVRSQEPKYKMVSLQKILQNVKRSIHFSENIQLSLPTNEIMINCDPDQIEVVLENIILNSSQAIGEDSGSITISFHEENENVLILIQDSGGGIPENIISQIFDPLFTTKRGGTGLGLASCKSIIESHNGTLTVKNNPTTFKIKLPKNTKI